MQIDTSRPVKKVAALILRKKPDCSHELLVYAFGFAPPLPLRVPGGNKEKNNLRRER